MEYFISQVYLFVYFEIPLAAPLATVSHPEV